jgi:hypothetical protein
LILASLALILAALTLVLAALTLILLLALAMMVTLTLALVLALGLIALVHFEEEQGSAMRSVLRGSEGSEGYLESKPGIT